MTVQLHTDWKTVHLTQPSLALNGKSRIRDSAIEKPYTSQNAVAMHIAKKKPKHTGVWHVLLLI